MQKLTLRKAEWLVQGHAAGMPQCQNPSRALDLILKEDENIPKFMTNKQESDSLVVMEEEANTFGPVQHSPESAKWLATFSCGFVKFSLPIVFMTMTKKNATHDFFQSA